MAIEYNLILINTKRWYCWLICDGYDLNALLDSIIQTHRIKPARAKTIYVHIKNITNFQK